MKATIKHLPLENRTQGWYNPPHSRYALFKPIVWELQFVQFGDYVRKLRALL